jgi:deoxyribodipyrimidine photo-lyase
MRVHDNTALVRAARDHDTVIPLYIVDTDYFAENDPGYPRTRFWRTALDDLREQFADRDTALVVRTGKPPSVIPEIIDATAADAVYTNRSYTPYGRDRDTRVADTIDIPLNAFKDTVLHDRDEIMTKSGTPYQVYSYYRDQWFSKEKREPQDVPSFTVPAIDSDTIPPLQELGVETVDIDEWWDATRAGGLDRLDAFNDRIDAYDGSRDYPARSATSRLSPHLKFGTVSIREAFQAAQTARDDGADREAVRTWQEQLAWRDFYVQLLWHWPETVEDAFREKYRDISWKRRENATERWERWTHGTTGFPFVDAGMRQLRQTGWMHNRVRMVVTSFACKDLWLDWRDVHDYFNRWFVDAEIAAMVGGIQWAYSIGTDAQPYFRVFNPFSQGDQYDPDGTYIRKWVDELADVPDDHIHRPHQMPDDVQNTADCRIGDDYPAPIVDHGERRETAIERFKAAAE